MSGHFKAMFVETKPGIAVKTFGHFSATFVATKVCIFNEASFQSLR